MTPHCNRLHEGCNMPWTCSCPCIACVLSRGDYPTMPIAIRPHPKGTEELGLAGFDSLRSDRWVTR